MHPDWKGHKVRLRDGRGLAEILRQDEATFVVTLKLPTGEEIKAMPGEFDLFPEEVSNPMNNVDFKPSEVAITACFPPLVDTFEKVEKEIAATIIVRALAVKGDVWRAIDWEDVIAVLRDDYEAVGTKDPIKLFIKDLLRNPFCRPDAYGLCDRGYAQWVGTPGDTIEFTEIGLERLRKWVPKKGG